MWVNVKKIVVPFLEFPLLCKISIFFVLTGSFILFVVGINENIRSLGIIIAALGGFIGIMNSRKSKAPRKIQLCIITAFILPFAFAAIMSFVA